MSRDVCAKRRVGRREWLACGLAALSPAWAHSQPTGAVLRPWPKGQATPGLSLPGFDGPGFKLAEAKGRPVLLNFWASWCEPCRAEMPSLELLAQRHEREGLIVMAVNQRETDAAIRRYLQLMPISLPVLRDTDGSTSRAWGARVLPTTVAVGRDGRAQFTVMGELDWTGPLARQWIAPLFT